MTSIIYVSWTEHSDAEDYLRGDLVLPHLPVFIWYMTDRLDNFGCFLEYWLSCRFWQHPWLYLYITVVKCWLLCGHTFYVICSLCHKAWEIIFPLMSALINSIKNKPATSHFGNRSSYRVYVLPGLSYQYWEFQISNLLDKANSCTLFPKMTIISKLYIYTLYSILFSLVLWFE